MNNIFVIKPIETRSALRNKHHRQMNMSYERNIMLKLLTTAKNVLYICPTKLTGFTNTASDCSSEGKGSEILFFLFYRDVIRYTVNNTFIPYCFIHNNPTVTSADFGFKKVTCNNIISSFRVLNFGNIFCIT